MKSFAPIEPLPVAGPVLTCFDSIEPQQVDWLWPNRVALGKLTLLTGDPGLGKSFITLDMAARVSGGLPWPDLPSSLAVRGGVVLLSAEDDPADTIRPRLDALGADPAKVKLLSAVRCERPRESDWGGPKELSETHVDLSRHMPEIESAIQQTPDCRLVIIDPIAAYLGCTDSHRDAALRGVLSPVANLAAKHHVAVVLVAHLNKSGGGKAIYRSSGSIAFIAAARSAWSVTKDKDDASRRLMLPLKNNLGPDVMGLAYTIGEEPGTDGPVVVWDQEPVSLSADEALSDFFIGGSDEQHDEVMEWLSEALAGSEGVRAAAMLEQAKANGFTAKAARKALKALGGRTWRKGFAEEGTWYWSLPRGADLPIDAIDSKPPQTGINGNNGNQ